jgi:hypothetical protein
MCKPTELAITIAAMGGVGYASNDGWLAADQIRHRLTLLGFHATTQQVAAWLARMARTDAPWVERRRSPWGDWEYRVTMYGRNDIDNRLPGIKPVVYA